MRPTRPPLRRRLVAAVAVMAAGALLSACSPPADVADPTPSAPAEATSAGPGTESPGLRPEGTAADNLPLFVSVMESVASSPDAVAGRAYVDALVAAGFDKAAMQVTADRTSVDDPVDSLQFSVLWQGECLVGQVGPSTPAPIAMVLPELPQGGCLIGLTRPIDW